MVRVQSFAGPCGAGVSARVPGVSGSEDTLDGTDEAGPSTRGLIRGWGGTLVVFDERDVGSPAGGREAKTAGSELGVHLLRDPVSISPSGARL